MLLRRFQFLEPYGCRLLVALKIRMTGHLGPVTSHTGCGLLDYYPENSIAVPGYARSPIEATTVTIPDRTYPKHSESCTCLVLVLDSICPPTKVYDCWEGRGHCPTNTYRQRALYEPKGYCLTRGQDLHHTSANGGSNRHYYPYIV